MLSSTTMRRLGMRATVPRLAAKLVPANQPMEGDLGWFTRDPLGREPAQKASPSINQLVNEKVFVQVAENLAQQKAALENNSSSSPSNTPNPNLNKVNLSADLLNAAKARHETILKEAKVYTHDGQEMSEGTSSQYVQQLDLSAMPEIPGVSKEELAHKMLEFQKIKAQQSAMHLSGEAQKNLRLNQIESMRLALQPQQFKEFMARMDKAALESEAELEKMRTMTPQELFNYQHQKARKKAIWQWVNLFFYWTMAAGGSFMMYYIMYEHFAI